MANVGRSTKTNGKLSADEFIVTAIRKLREVENEKARTKGRRESKGIHSVYSGFNAAFKSYFGGDASPVDATKSAAERDVIDIGGARGGAMLYLPGEAPAAWETQEARNGKTLAAMGL